MNFQEYDMLASGTASYPEIGKNVVYPALGAIGEGGELVEKVLELLTHLGKVAENSKKLWRNHGTTDANGSWSVGLISTDEQCKIEALLLGIRKEAGDVLWYLNAIAKELGTTLEIIAEENIAKLRDRRERSVINSVGDKR